MRGLITHKDYEVEFFEYGSGDKIIFAFHGFNNHAEDFRTFGEVTANHFKTIAINLFFHGTSIACSDIVERGFTVEDLKGLFNKLSMLFPAEKYTLIGYSLGGRIALKIMEICPEKIERLILIAPDGIKINPIYRNLTQTSSGQKLFKQVTNNPSIFFVVAMLLRKLRLVTEKKYFFALNNFDSKQKREKLYLVWMIFRKIISDQAHLKKIIKKNNINIDLFYGKHDRIIPSAIGKNFRKGMEANISFHDMDSGHQLLKEKILKEIANIVMHK
jgi:pimeloyl-ACP methyl ester carboxylesterase